jgi:hypothetical protein
VERACDETDFSMLGRIQLAPNDTASFVQPQHEAGNWASVRRTRHDLKHTGPMQSQNVRVAGSTLALPKACHFRRWIAFACDMTRSV